MKTKIFNIAFCMAIASAEAFGSNGLFNLEQVDLLEEKSFCMDDQDDARIQNHMRWFVSKEVKRYKKFKNRLLSLSIKSSQAKRYNISRRASFFVPEEEGNIQKAFLRHEGKNLKKRVDDEIIRCFAKITESKMKQ